MKLEELYTEWANDAPIDKTNAGEESLKIPQLQHKYTKLLSKERVKIIALKEKRKQLETTLEDYFEGRIDGKDIGRPPFQFVVRTSAKVEKLISTDKEMVDINVQMAMCEEKTLYMKDILISLNQRNYIIKNFIDFQKFVNGH